MTLAELLKSQGLDDAQVTKIVSAMKENKIYTASEENLDVRYGKLKGQHDGLTAEHTEAQALIEQLKAGAQGNEDMQSKITDYESRVTALEAEKTQLQVDNAIRFALLKSNAKPDDIDYLIYRIKQGDDEIKLDKDGNVKGVDALVDGIKQAHPSQFETAADKEILENKLKDGDQGKVEPKDLGEALRQQFEAQSGAS